MTHDVNTDAIFDVLLMGVLEQYEVETGRRFSPLEEALLLELIGLRHKDEAARNSVSVISEAFNQIMTLVDMPLLRESDFMPLPTAERWPHLQ